MVLRFLIYLPVLFLICVVVIGQRHDNAKDTLRGAVRATVRMVVYTVILVVGMQAVQLLFID
jgi:hypothetical protein